MTAWGSEAHQLFLVAVVGRAGVTWTLWITPKSAQASRQLHPSSLALGRRLGWSSLGHLIWVGAPALSGAGLIVGKQGREP